MQRPRGAPANSIALVMAALGLLVGLVGVLVGCSDRDPLALTPAQPAITKPTVPLGEPGPPASGGSIDPGTPPVTIVAADGLGVDGSRVAAVSAALSAATGQDLVMGAEFNRRFLAVQVRAIGFSADATGCVVSAGETAAGAGFATLTVSQLGGVMGQAGPAIAGCLGATGLPPDLGNPDFSRAPVADVRAVLGELSAATFLAAGLTSDEASCVSKRQLDGFDDVELGQLFESTASSRPLSDDVAACVTSARIVAIAGS